MPGPRIYPAAAVLAIGTAVAFASPTTYDANRLTYLDEFSNPYWANHTTARLATEQWIGEPGVEFAIVLSVDDMSDHTPFENYLRPILERLKQIDGRAPVSIMSNRPDPNQPHLQTWLKEGLSIETHTLHHPCPLLHGGNFPLAAANFHGCVDLLSRVPNSVPVCFRMPCMDSINSVSPRFYAEIFNHKSDEGRFLTMSSSVMVLYTEGDPDQPAGYATDPDGRGRFAKYVAGNAGWVNYLENYPYPFVIGKIAWELPTFVPDDWQGQHLQGNGNPGTVADMKAAIDATARKHGVYTMTFHTANWIFNHQIVDVIDHAVNTYGSRVKFLNFREVQDRLNRNMLAGHPIRNPQTGQDNGVRILDINNDGYMDVVIGNDNARITRIWDPQAKKWNTTDFPVPIVTTDAQGITRETGVRFGVIQPGCEPEQKLPGYACFLVINEKMRTGYYFNGSRWVELPELARGLEANGPIFTSRDGVDRGVRLRDLDNDGICELIVANDTQSAVFQWLACKKTWAKQAITLPQDTAIVDAQGRDAGLRFVDVDQDGHADVVFSNADRYSLHLFRSMETGWSIRALSGNRGQADATREIPMIVRADGTNNGAWFLHGYMWVQNEDTAGMPNLVDRRSFDQLLATTAPNPKDPQASLKAMRPRRGFTVELVAAEPLVMDPIAFDWGPDGKLWVVEMADYPLGIDNRGKPGGRIRFLEDTDGDGKYDKSTLFAEGIAFPTDVMVWRDGILVTAAPNVLYLRDTNGDGKADAREVLFTGFGEGNQQHRVNGLRWGLDNWIYLANGDSGGHIRSVKTGDVVDMNGRDLRIRPDTGELDATTGMTQYGRNRNDWGDWFGCNNSLPMWHFVLPDHYLRRNPHVGVSQTNQLVATLQDSPIYPAGRVLLHSVGAQPPAPGEPSRFTSACSAIVYRDTLFGDAFAENMFVSEPVHNLVHRRILEPAGATFTSRKPEDEARIEFLASTDSWFRPTTVRTGPDGALWVADMYRMVIEHPEWIDDALKRELDLRAGHDRGRIYRVYPSDRLPRPMPRMADMTTAQLVAALRSPNGWQRDMAHRMILWRNDRAAVPLLRDLATKGNEPLARLHALCVLDGLAALDATVVEAALNDEHPGVRRHAVRLTEQFAGRAPRLLDALIKRVNDNDARVQLQLAFTLGEWDDSRAGEALGQLAALRIDDGFIIAAAMSSATRRPADMVAGLMRRTADPARIAPIVNQLIDVALARGSEDAAVRLMTAIAQPGESGYANWQFEVLARLRQTLERSGKTLDQLPQAGQTAQRLAEAIRAARQIALDDSQPVSRRAAAIPLLGYDRAAVREDIAALVALLTSQAPHELQRAALTALAAIRDDTVAPALLRAWPSYSNTLRQDVLSVLMRRQESVTALLDAVEAKRIAPAELGATYRQLLTEHADASIRNRAVRLLETGSPVDRQAVIDRYLSHIASAKADPQRGIAVFSEHCAQCHRVGSIGQGAGPNLAGLVDKSPQYMVPHILDPNRAVEDKYLNHTLQTVWGDMHTGLLVNETGQAVTLMGLDGVEVTVLRSEIASFERSTRSMMPEGLEAFVSPQDMADIIAFVNANVAPPKQFAGNKPALVRPGDQGELRLLATNAEIYGDTLVFEGHYQNLGYWMSDNDHAAWSVQVAVDGRYDVWLDWAAPSNPHDHRLAVVIGNQTIDHTIAPTGTWDDYRLVKIGTVELRAGVHRVIAQPGTPVREAMLDLRELRLVPEGLTVEKPAYKIVAGNKPEAVAPDNDGSLRLLASNAELYGDRIAVYEPQRCIGWWTSEQDRAVWRIRNAKARRYDVVLEWAIPDDMAGNRFAITADDSRLEGTIPTTGSFENYRRQKFGQIELKAGDNVLEMRSIGPIKGELADLREIHLVPAQ